MLQLAAKAGISKREAGVIIDEVLASTRQIEASFPDLTK